MPTWLNPEQAARYRHLTTPALGQVLAGVNQPPLPAAGTLPASCHLAAGLTFAGLPAALAVVSLGARGEARLQSLMVAPPFRRLGLARTLVEWLVQEARQQGWLALAVSYPLDQPSTAAMQLLTQAEHGWHRQPGLRLVHLDRRGGQVLVDRLAPLAAHWRRSGRFGSMRWHELPAADQAQLGARLQAPAWVWPQRDETEGVLIGALDPVNSLILLDHNEPAGWLIAHRVGSDLFRVSQWWVIPRLQSRGVSLLLLHQAVLGALASQPVYEGAVFGLDPDNEAMHKLSRQQLEPLAHGVQTSERSRLVLAMANRAEP